MFKLCLMHIFNFRIKYIFYLQNFILQFNTFLFSKFEKRCVFVPQLQMTFFIDHSYLYFYIDKYYYYSKLNNLHSLTHCPKYTSNSTTPAFLGNLLKLKFPWNSGKVYSPPVILLPKWLHLKLFKYRWCYTMAKKACAL